MTTAYLKPDAVIDAFSQWSEIPREELLEGTNTTRQITAARHMLMWLLRDLTASSFSTIGAIIGGRDDKTIHSAVNKVADQIAADPSYKERLLAARAVCLASRPAKLMNGDNRALSARVIAVTSVLHNPKLSDCEARIAAVQILAGIVEVQHATH